MADFIFSFKPNWTPIEDQSDYFKEVIFAGDQEKSLFIKPFFDHLLMMLFAYSANDMGVVRNFVDNLLQKLYDQQNDSYWVSLSQDEKLLLLLELIEIADNLYELFPKVLSQYFKNIVHLPSLRERPKEVYLLSENSFS